MWWRVGRWKGRCPHGPRVAGVGVLMSRASGVVLSPCSIMNHRRIVLARVPASGLDSLKYIHALCDCSFLVARVPSYTNRVSRCRS